MAKLTKKEAVLLGKAYVGKIDKDKDFETVREIFQKKIKDPKKALRKGK